MAEAAAETEMVSSLNSHMSSINDAEISNRNSSTARDAQIDISADDPNLTADEKAQRLESSRQAKIAIEETEEKSTQAKIKALETRIDALEKIGKVAKLGGSFDITDTENEAQQKFVKEKVIPNLEKGLENTSKNTGKTLKELSESPEEEKWLKKKLEKYLGKRIGGGLYEHRGLIVIILASLIANLIMKFGVLPQNEKNALGKDYFAKFIPKGCIQYHIKTGTIRPIGICGDPCANNTDQASCSSNTSCSWNNDTSKCSLSDISCCPSCSGGGDCISKLNLGSNASVDTKQYCSVDADCLIGSCQSNTCRINSDNFCDTDSSSCLCPLPGVDLGIQMNSSKLGFCDPDSSLPCPAASRICSLTSNGGLCNDCGDQDYCKNPSGNLSQKDTFGCMCSNPDNKEDWITIPVCIQPEDFFLSVVNVASGVDEWAPDTTTPLSVKILTWGSILGIMILTTWYLIKVIKTLRNKNK